MHGCDGGSDGGSDGAAYAAAYRRANSCTNGCAYCGAHCGTNRFTDRGAYCDAVGEADCCTYSRAHGCTYSRAHCCSLGVAHSGADSPADACTNASSVRRRLARMPRREERWHLLQVWPNGLVMWLRSGLLVL